MTIDLLNIKPHRVSRSLREKIVFIYGEPKSGKTTLASKFPKPLLLAFEKGYNAIDGIRPQPINKWSEFQQVLKQLQKPEVKEMYDTIIIDTIDIAKMTVEEHTCQKNLVEKIGDIPYGAGYKEVRQELEKSLRSIPAMGYGLVMISHEGSEEALDPSGNPYKKITPTLDSKSKVIVSGMADIYGYIRTVMNPDTGETDTYLYMRGTPYFEAGSRFTHIDSHIPLSYNNLVDAIERAINKEAELGAEIVDAPDHNVYAEKERDFTEIMDRATQLIQSLMEKVEGRSEEVVQTLINRITKIVDTHLGQGRKLNTATETQVEMVVLVVQDLQELLEEYEQWEESGDLDK